MQFQNINFIPGGMPPDPLAIVARMLALHADYASYNLAKQDNHRHHKLKPVTST